MEVEAYLNVLEAWANELPATLATNSRHKHRAIKAAIELMEKHAQLPQKIALLPPSAQLILSESNEGTDESEDKDNSEDDDSQDTHSDAANSDNSTDRVAGGIEIRAHPLEIRTVYLTDIWWTGDPLYMYATVSLYLLIMLNRSSQTQAHPKVAQQTSYRSVWV